MKKDFNPFIIEGFQVEGQCRDDSFYVRFKDEDIEELALFAFDMGYSLEPELIAVDPEHPMRFKIISKANPAVYGWISKVIEKIDDSWQDVFLYGFYRHGSFRNKYPVTFNIQSRQMRGIIKHKAERNPRHGVYFRTLFGIMDLEQEVNPLEFIFSWLWSVKFQKTRYQAIKTCNAY
jgi:hypothetical protein